MTILDITSAIKARLSARQIERLGAIAAWDFDTVKDRARTRLSWSNEHAATALDGYRQFLVLIAINPDKTYGMAGDVDEIWHDHILDTRDYMAMCAKLTGGYIHHESRTADLSPANRVEYYSDHTLVDLNLYFDSRISPIWPEASSALGNAKCCTDHVQVGEELN
jgi:hypothetical protein